MMHAGGDSSRSTLEGIVGALAGQIIVLLAQNRALQEILARRGIADLPEVRDLTLTILETDLDSLADDLLPEELSVSVKATLREALRSARGGG
ncbi:MAG: hypothetical protein FJ033_08410 [Chloroflexi bacterium]|nr:hypothetical protein [Chloroflexota bacterium]